MAKGGFPKGMSHGGGMGGMNIMIKQAQKMQEDMLKTQAELETREFSMTSGGGAVEAVVNGKKTLVKITIDPEVIDPDGADMLQDLIITAVNGALQKVEETSEKEMAKFTGGMNFPGLF